MIFTNELAVITTKVGQREAAAGPLSAAFLGVVPTPAQLAGLGFPRQELGSSPGLPQGLALG